MKKTIMLFLCCAILAGAIFLPIHAQEKSYSWYCKHVKDHAQPSLDEGLAFVEELGGYYLDRHATDADKVIYLTFDAGYENGNVAKTLDILRDEGVPVAFFVLEHLITHDTELVKRMADEGHLVCNHTARHKDMSSVSNEAFLAELTALEQIYNDTVGGELSRYYRPPEGKFSRQNLLCASENGYKTVFWSFAYPDWDNNRQMSPDKALQIILDNAHNGEVMLLHPTSETNVAILGEVIRTLKSEGYRFGTLDELTEKGE